MQCFSFLPAKICLYCNIQNTSSQTQSEWSKWSLLPCCERRWEELPRGRELLLQSWWSPSLLPDSKYDPDPCHLVTIHLDPCNPHPGENTFIGSILSSQLYWWIGAQCADGTACTSNDRSSWSAIIKGWILEPWQDHFIWTIFSGGPGQTAARGLTKTGWPMPALNLVPSMSKGNDFCHYNIDHKLIQYWQLEELEKLEL